LKDMASGTYVPIAESNVRPVAMHAGPGHNGARRGAVRPRHAGHRLQA